MKLEVKSVKDRQDAWEAKAFAEGIRCGRCGTTIPYGEQNIYFERGICGWCAHMEDKDD